MNDLIDHNKFDVTCAAFRKTKKLLVNKNKKHIVEWNNDSYLVILTKSIAKMIEGLCCV